MKKRSAFTLIELSIVILIVTILLAGFMLGNSLVSKTYDTINTYISSNIPTQDQRLLKSPFGVATASRSSVLDTLSSAPAAAYSVTKLSSSYSGKALRVRRSSDNLQQDIGFTSGGLLDEDALTTFVGSVSAYVVTWYDQSGNARNLTQATDSAQPTIVLNGVISKKNGIPTLLHDAINDGMSCGCTNYLSALPLTVNGVAGSTAESAGFIKVLFGGTSTQWFIGKANNFMWFAGGYNINTPGGSSTWSKTGFDVVTAIEPSSGNPTLYRNGTSQTLTGASKGLPGTINIGYGPARFQAADGHISELIVFASELSSTDREALESSQMAYY